jgi:ATP sulfurylase
MAKRANIEPARSCGTSDASVIRQLMNGWDMIMAAAKREHPHLSHEEHVAMTRAAMSRSLGLKC